MTVPNDTSENLIHVIEKITANLHIFFIGTFPQPAHFREKSLFFIKKSKYGNHQILSTHEKRPSSEHRSNRSKQAKIGAKTEHRPQKTSLQGLRNRNRQKQKKKRDKYLTITAPFRKFAQINVCQKQIHMKKKGLLATLCLLAVSTASFAESVILKPNWKTGETRSYAATQYEDTTLIGSTDMLIKVLDDSNDYKMSCTYLNYVDHSGMEEMAASIIGKEIFEKIKEFVPTYTVSKTGEILKVDNFDEYLKIYETTKDTAGAASPINGLFSSIMKTMLAADEKSFMEINLKEVLAQHKFFGKEYDTEKETKGTTEIVFTTMQLKNAKYTTKVEKSGDKITIKTNAELAKKECLASIKQWMEKYMANIAKETGLDANSPEMKKQIKESMKTYKKVVISANSQESATFDAKTGWLISYQITENFLSTEGSKSETLIITPK